MSRPKPPGRRSFLLADLHVRDRFVGRLADGRVRQLLDVESGPGSAMRYISMRFERRHAMRTLRLGSRRPPHSMALSSSSRNA